MPSGKRADFGYDKDFDERYSLGKLLGHGQFGYTYVGVDKASGDRVAVKRLEKSKVIFVSSFKLSLFCFVLFCFSYLVIGLGFKVSETWKC